MQFGSEDAAETVRAVRELLRQVPGKSQMAVRVTGTLKGNSGTLLGIMWGK